MLRIASGWIVACALLLAGCQGQSQPLHVWAGSDMLSLSPDTPPPPDNETFDAPSATVSIFSVINETVSFQVVLDAGPAGAQDVKLSCGPLETAEGKKLDPSAIRFFAMQSVEVKDFPAWVVRLAEKPVGPTQVYDGLAEMDERTGLSIAPGQRLAVWADVRVPSTAFGGTYAGAIAIRSGLNVQHLTLRLKVYDVVLPQQRAVTCLGSFSHQEIFRQFIRRANQPYSPTYLDANIREVRDGLTILRQLLRNAHDHQLDLFDPTLHPLLKRDDAGNAVLKWDEYDNIVKPYVDGSAFDDHQGSPAWPLPVCLAWPDPADYGGADSPRYLQTAQLALEQSVRHLDSLVGAGRVFAWPGMAEVSGPAYMQFLDMARLVRSTEPQLPILSTLSPVLPVELSSLLPNDFAGMVDMAAPAGDLLAFNETARLVASNRPLSGVWLRPGKMPYVGACGLPAGPADVRCLPWIALKYHCAGIFIPDVLGLANPASENVLYGVAAGAATDNQPLRPTVRLKRLRRGLQDASYLYLLRQHRQEALAEEMVNVMVRYAGLEAAGDNDQDARLDGWLRQGWMWVAARKLLAEECLAAVHPESVNNETLMAQRLAWQHLQEQVGRVRLERVVCRVDMPSPRQFLAQAKAEFFNERIHPADVSLQLGNLPAGWQSPQDQLAYPAMPALTRGGLMLQAQGDHVPTGVNARLGMPLTLLDQGRKQAAWDVGAPFLLAGVTDRPITVDGDLSDWPLRPGNAAADFELIGRRGPFGQIDAPSPAAAGRAVRQTVAFAVHDSRYLYLAFRCEEPEMSRLSSRPDNRVRYDQLLAKDEDLVEVLLDPGRNAQGPQDLYHLVIKSNAIILAQRGIPPLGRAEPWSADIRVAIQKQPQRWVVEVAIPLDSLGTAGAEKMWGINFARYATVGAEASSWSGAARYFYSPDYLGGMRMLDKGEDLPLDTTQPAKPK